MSALKTKLGHCTALPAQPLGERVGEAEKPWSLEELPPRQVQCEGHGVGVKGQGRQGSPLVHDWRMGSQAPTSPAPQPPTWLPLPEMQQPGPWQKAPGVGLGTWGWKCRALGSLTGLQWPGCLRRAEEFPVPHRLRRLEDKMFCLPRVSPAPASPVCYL